MTGTMTAAVAGPRGLSLATVPRPLPGPGQVGVQVAAAGLNRLDLSAATGAPEGWGKPIGMEWAGVVVETGPGVAGLRAGDRVACTGKGGYAEFAATDAWRCFPLGAGMDFAQAAVLPLALMTAHDALVTQGRLAAGEAVLVQGASSAVGLMALQIAASQGAGVIAGLARDPARRGRLGEFGATLALDPQERWMEVLAEATDGRGADIIIDMVSGNTLAASLEAAAICGRIINVGRLGGDDASFDCGLHALKRLKYIGVTFRTRTPEEVREIVARVRDDLWAKVAAGRLRLPVDSSFRLDQVADAHEHMRANRHFGKIVLLP